MNYSVKRKTNGLKRSRELTAIDLFSGAGGLAEGLETAGIRVTLAVELHPQPALTHAFNHPETSVLVGDIRKLNLELVETHAGAAAIDIVVGGPPCQGFSTAGKKVAEDPRNNLFRQFQRVVGHFRPRMFLLENVPGFAEMHKGRALNEARELFLALGYKLKYEVLNAARYGVPQRRHRFFMVGWLPDEVSEFQWPEPTHFVKGKDGHRPLFDGIENPLKGIVTVEEAIGDLAFLNPGWEAHRHEGDVQSPFQMARRNGCDLLFNHLATKHRERALTMFSFIPEGGTISSVPTKYRSGKRTMARLDRRSLSNAVLAMPDDLVHYEHDRIPTAREMARLQTFDDDYVFIGKRTSGFIERRVDVPQYTQIGNAVPPLLAKALGKEILRSFDVQSTDCRNLLERRRRHALICGSSGFAGYRLDPLAEKMIRLENIDGEALALPISDNTVSVLQAPPLREWVTGSNPKKGQWAPGVQPRELPSYMELGR